MKILIVSSYLPYPLFSGGQVRLYNLIKELSKQHQITLICEKRPHQTDTDIAEVEKICSKVLTVERRKQWSVGNVIKAGFSSNSFLVTGHTQDLLQELIVRELGNADYDLIHVETYYVFQNVPQTSLPVVLAEHNIEYKVYEKFLKRAPSLLRPLLAIDVSKIKKEEKMFWQKANALVAVSQEDKKVMEQKGLHPSLVSNGVNTDQFRFKNVTSALGKKEKRILFIGDFKWIQNKDSVTYIIQEVWPKIKTDSGQARMTDIKLWIVGRKIPDTIKSLTSDSDVIFDEKSSAKPTPEIFQEAAVLLAPIRVGGGTSYKILESMSCGTPVVTMQMSADAIAAKDDHEIMVGKSAEELAEKTVKLLQDKALYEKIAHGGRRLIEQNYTWKMIAGKLEDVYKTVVK